MCEELLGLFLVVVWLFIVVGYCIFGCQVFGSIFWVFCMGFVLESFICGLDEQIDVILVDYCVEVLIGLVLKLCLGYSFYYIFVGYCVVCIFGEIDEVFVCVNGVVLVGECYCKVEVDDFKELVKSFELCIGLVNLCLVLCVLCLYSGFVDFNYLFDNSCLFEEGIFVLLCFIDYFDVCVQLLSVVSILVQM